MKGMFVALSSAVLLGCGSAGSTPSSEPAPNPPETGRIWALGEVLKEGRISNIQPGVDRVSNDIPAPPDQVWTALIDVYAEVGIDVTGKDPSSRTLNNPEFQVSRRLGGERLSRYLSCGSGLTGAFADRFRVHMSILSQVAPGQEGGSVLHTTIQAFGINPEGTSNTRVPCGSTHQLEYRIAQSVAERVGR